MEQDHKKQPEINPLITRLDQKYVADISVFGQETWFRQNNDRFVDAMREAHPDEELWLKKVF